MKKVIIGVLLAFICCFSSVTIVSASELGYLNEDDEIAQEELEIQREIKATKKCKTSITSIKNDRQVISVKFKKKKGYKYEVQYCRYKSFKKSVTTVTVSKPKYTSAKLTNRVYYVRVRVYKRIDGKTYYGKYSKVKKVKIQ